MKHIGIMALMIQVGVAALYAHQRPVSMTFSGTGGLSAINLQQPGTATVEENVGGKGTLGSFTFRHISAETSSPQSSATCAGSTHIYFLRLAGAGVFRFKDGSLLNVTLTDGADCIDLVAREGHCTVTFKITGGTGRFKDASGSLTFTEISKPVLADAFNNPVYFTEVGEFSGTIWGVPNERDEDRDERH